MGLFSTLSIMRLKCNYAEYHIFYCYAECYYAECHYAKCRGAVLHYSGYKLLPKKLWNNNYQNELLLEIHTDIYQLINPKSNNFTTEGISTFKINSFKDKIKHL
jgi:hypothetical protein